jgi:hypothetical protein
LFSAYHKQCVQCTGTDNVMSIALVVIALAVISLLCYLSGEHVRRSSINVVVRV